MERPEVPALPTVIHFSYDIVAATPRQVERYAGGGGYRAGSRVETAIIGVINQARGLAVPAVATAVHAVSGFSEDGRLLLENGLSLKTPSRERYPAARWLVSVVCTVGPVLEEACRVSAAGGDVLTSVLLDAAGVATMENLAELAYGEVTKHAGRRGLGAGCRFAPGCGKMPLSSQKILFRLVNAGSVGVRLNRSMVMLPAKSLSFFVILADGGSPGRGVYKCRACSLKDCRFRTSEPDSHSR